MVVLAGMRMNWRKFGCGKREFKGREAVSSARVDWRVVKISSIRDQQTNRRSLVVSSCLMFPNLRVQFVSGLVRYLYLSI